MTKTQELIDAISKDERIIRYKKIEEIITKDKFLKRLINELKAIQKQLVNAETLSKNEALILFKKAYEEKLSQIDEHPLLSEYLALQGDINYMLQEIVGIIEDGINKDIEL